jgi:hypothetical protein
MKYFKILRINYNDNLEAIYCKELETEEIKNEDGTSKIFTKYKKIGYLYGDTVLEEENENIENKTIRAITEEDWKKEISRKMKQAELAVEKAKEEIKKNEKYQAELEAELAELEKAEA